jgi:hypothetical protein
MSKYQKHIFNLTAIENKTGIRKLKINEYLMGKTQLCEAEQKAIINLITKEAKLFIQLFYNGEK